MRFKSKTEPDSTECTILQYANEVFGICEIGRKKVIYMSVIPAVPGTGHQRGESAPKSYNVSVSLVNDVDILMSLRRCNLDDFGRCQYPRINVR